MDSDFIDDFIEEYKNQPCLWQASSIDFKNRKKRQEAYHKLIEVASKHGQHYNIERTKQKINNLRCAFRHQLKKFTESKNNKSGKEDTYCPKRRYFESLMFLLNEERAERSKSDNQREMQEVEQVETITETYTMSMQEHDDQKETTEIITTQHLKDDVVIEPTKENRVQIEVQCDEEVNIAWPRHNSTPKPSETILHLAPTNITEPEPRTRTLSVSSHASSQSARSENASKKVKIDCSATNFEKLLSLACSKMNSSETISEDEFAIFGKMVAYKLRSMDTQQSYIAEKLITDILLEGQMKLLTYPVRSLPYRPEQAFVISGLNINGTTEPQTERSQQYPTSTIQYSTGNGSQM